MQTVKVSTDNVVSLVNIDFDDYQSIQKAIGGHFETVRTRTTASYFGSPDIVMLVDEEGLLKGLPVNVFGSLMYGGAAALFTDCRGPDPGKGLWVRTLRRRMMLRR